MVCKYHCLEIISDFFLNELQLYFLLNDALIYDTEWPNYNFPSEIC